MKVYYNHRISAICRKKFPEKLQKLSCGDLAGNHASFDEKEPCYGCAVICRGTGKRGEKHEPFRHRRYDRTGCGLAAGTAMYAATNMTTARQRRKMKKAANRAMKNVEGIVSDMAYIMKP